MNALPIQYDPRAVDDLRSVPPVLVPGVKELLSRLSVNYRTCSFPGPTTRPPGWECGTWFREPSGAATLVEVLFRIHADEERILVRRVILTAVERLPAYVENVAEWGLASPWPIVDV